MARIAPSHLFTLRAPVIALSIATAFGLAAAGPAYAQVSVDVGVTAQSGWLYDIGAVVSVFIDPPVQEPEPVAVAWAPPPMLVEELPPQPDPDAVWTGGYWAWQGDWVWCAGRWMDPPRQEYVWVQPYYEHRDSRVIFIPGYWSAPDVEFIAPPVERPIAWAYVNEGVVIGPSPEGPVGIFIPPPPGSRPGLIIPAPIGTPPAVVISAPPVMAVGMRVTGAVSIDARRTVNDNRVTNYSVTNVRNITNVTIEAPASATANGRAFQGQVPHQAHLAASMRPQVAARAPTPATRTAVAAYSPGHAMAALPVAQMVRGLPAVPSHGAATLSQAQRAQMSHAPLTPEEARQTQANGHHIGAERSPATAASPQGARPAQLPTPQAKLGAQPAEQPRGFQDQMQPRAPMQEQQRAQVQQPAQLAEQRRAEQETQQQTQQQVQQRVQQEQTLRAEQQRAPQGAQQRTQSQTQQRWQQEQAQRAEQQRAQQDTQQRSQQEQAQRAEQQRALQESQKRIQQPVAQRAQLEQVPRAEPQRTPQARGESAHGRGEEASRPSN